MLEQWENMGFGVTTMGSNHISNTFSSVNLNIPLLSCKKWESFTKEIMKRKLPAFHLAHEIIGYYYRRAFLTVMKNLYLVNKYYFAFRTS